MKISVIIPQNEVRQAKFGEYYQSDNAWFYCSSTYGTHNSYPIGIAHKVEVPV
ncbi:MAG: hypothetical protein A4E65_01153 [Syntrophorhabdus sp. PtaU1.Bin153]|nr:MAG: hypothetical protein A4E65_01153 [Syntrophorhabdus sp. PtaU1.Bin153]